MFKIGSGRFTWLAVRWKGLAEDGTSVENEVDLQVELVDRPALQKQLADEDPNSGEAFAKSVVRNWKGVGDAEGAPLSFSPENFQQLYDSPNFNGAFATAYLQAWQGISGIREKNSGTSPADGQAAGAPVQKPAA